MELKAKIKREPDQTVETKGEFLVTNKSDAEVFKCVTLELANRGNKTRESCILPGVYLCRKTGPTKKLPYRHFAIENVYGRTGIRIHILNFAAGKKFQTLGCVGVGEYFKDLNGDGISDIANSGKTLEKLIEIMPDEFWLTIE